MEGYVARAIGSVLRQSLPPQEVIVVDDGSMDRTGLVAGGMEKVRVVRHDEARGLAEARNTGVRSARSAWVAFLDADDEWDDRKMERQARAAAEQGAGAVYCGVRLRTEGLADAREAPASTFGSERRLRRALLLHNCITGSASSMIVRREILEQCGGFDPALKRCEDRDMWIRLSWKTRFAAVREPLVTIWQRAGSLGSDPQKQFEAGWVVNQKHRALYSRYLDGRLLWRRAEAGLYERRGMARLSRGELRSARLDFRLAALRWPFRMKTLVPLMKLHLGLVRGPSSGA
jgi:glycosyltransferase involved in cell wall biosynthesis